MPNSYLGRSAAFGVHALACPTPQDTLKRGNQNAHRTGNENRSPKARKPLGLLHWDFFRHYGLAIRHSARTPHRSCAPWRKNRKNPHKSPLFANESLSFAAESAL